jgi:hypothetical protein
LLERAQQGGVILRIVFEVGILDEDILAAGIFKRSSDGRALAAVLFVEYDSDIITERHRAEFFAGAVCGTVIHDDDFLLHRRGVDGAQQFVHVRSLVVDRHQHRDASRPPVPLSGRIVPRRWLQ